MSRLPPHNERRIASWTLGRVADAVAGRWADESHRDRSLRGISTDTRSLQEGEVFVAISGENFDGHEFVKDARDAGAHGAIVAADFDPPATLPSDFPLLRVDSTRRALADLGRTVWQEATDEGAHTVDVTGSNGKTTTKELLRTIWSAHGEVFATPGNFNNEIGLPLTLCALPAEADHLVFELGANAPGEISELIEMAPGDERIITSIGVAHTEGFGSIEGIRRAKSEIFECAGPETVAIVPHREVEQLVLADFPGRILTFGRREGADLRLVDYREAEERTGVWKARYRGSPLGEAFDEFTVELGLPGAHNGLNLGAALLTLFARGVEVDPEALGRDLAQLELPAGRWRRWRRGDLAFIDDAYNANPSSVRASFSAFTGTSPPDNLGGDREPARIAVVGEMHELGEEAERWHRDVAAELVADGRLDAFIAVGGFAAEMAQAARARTEGVDVQACQTADDAAAWLLERAPAFVWMKASRANGLEQIIDVIEQTRDDG